MGVRQVAKRKTLKTPAELEEYSEEKDAERTFVRKEIELERARKTSSDWKRIAKATRKELEVAESRLDVLMASEEEPVDADPYRIRLARRRECR